MTPDVELQRLVKAWRKTVVGLDDPDDEFHPFPVTFLRRADGRARVIGYTPAMAPTPTQSHEPGPARVRVPPEAS